jgi:hypothetical protein
LTRSKGATIVLLMAAETPPATKSNMKSLFMMRPDNERWGSKLLKLQKSFFASKKVQQGMNRKGGFGNVNGALFSLKHIHNQGNMTRSRNSLLKFALKINCCRY